MKVRRLSRELEIELVTYNGNLSGFKFQGANPISDPKMTAFYGHAECGRTAVVAHDDVCGRAEHVEPVPQTS